MEANNKEIKTLSDLLKELRDKELVLMNSYGVVKHPGLIGGMYEGFTKKVLEQSIFDGLGLKVVAGIIRNSKGDFSGEIDCMLVVGEGEVLPHSDKFIYDSGNVVAVIQVKKNLYSKDVGDSFENLKSVVNVTEERDTEDYHVRLLHDAYRTTVMKRVPSQEELPGLTIEENLLYHVLLLEAFYPARIVWGYNGFKSHSHFRDSLVNFLEEKIPVEGASPIHGYGPLNLPSLIMCADYSLIKCNGMPFSFPLEGGWWNVMVSSNRNPLYFFLEVIWTRIQYMFKLPADIFGDDLEVDQVYFYLKCRPVERDGESGWEYYYLPIPDKHLAEELDVKEWEPVELNRAQFIVIFSLCKFREDIDFVSDREFITTLEKNGIEDVEEFVDVLCATGLTYKKNGKLGLLIDSCGIASLNGKMYAGENKSGRFGRWLKKNAAANNAEPEE
jgi:hypothetical protein